MFKHLNIIELDIVIRGLRLARRASFDSYEKNKTSDMLGEALEAKRFKLREPERKKEGIPA